MAKRHTFSGDELSRYFDRVCIPESKRVFDASKLSDPDKLAYLNLLQKHHLVKVPWENLTQHYSWHRVVHLKPEHLFRKIVESPGRGGYCMEVNFFFHLILYSLNFDVYMVGSRIYKEPIGRYGGWTHVVNLCRVGGERYLLDGGFGGQGPTRPVCLEHEATTEHVTPAQMRVVYENIPNNVDTAQKVWVYQHRHDMNSPWKPMYCFVDLEFTPEDVDSMNFAPSMSRHTFFTHKVVAVRFTSDREYESLEGPGSASQDALTGEIDGSITINHDVLKWRRHGKKVVVIPFKSDQERVDALKKYFGISLPEDDREAIINTAAMIGVGAMGVDD